MKLPRHVLGAVIRKSVGTLMARENPKLAHELGSTSHVFNARYHQPVLEDPVARRDLVPVANWQPRTP